MKCIKCDTEMFGTNLYPPVLTNKKYLNLKKDIMCCAMCVPNAYISNSMLKN